MNRVFNLKRLQLCALLLGAQTALGAPVVTGITGSVGQGAAITINGSGFGVNPAPVPIYYSDFDAYPAGTSALNAGLTALNGTIPNEPYVDNTRALSGSQALRIDYPVGQNGYFPEVGIGGLNVTQVYVSAWIYWQLTAGPGTEVPIFKLVRAEAGQAYHGYPGFYDTVFPNASGVISGVDEGSISSTDVVTYDDATNAEPNSGGWHRISYFYKLSTPGVANGVFQNWVDGVADANITDTMSLAPGSTATINNVISPFDGISNLGGNNAYSLWVDDFYVSATEARVELGDAATLSACKSRYIQPTTTWSDGTITATVETNTFAPGTKVYVYVFDANGNVNNDGYPVTISGVVPNAPLFDGVH